ncbi:MAG: GTP 3',8-cyclase MoaA [Acidobacteria bacterium]|nr:GTP 3',8-cyclase MoaA [Acidobacteriota bacterium]
MDLGADRKRDSLRDGFGREIGDLRISVTDRCNLRCVYCIPEETPTFQPRDELLTFEELERVTRIFVDAGVSKIRLTGGEPLLRKSLPELVASLSSIPGVADLAMTTNGIFLRDALGALQDAGLNRLNISLDTLRPERFRLLTRRGGLRIVLDAIRASRDEGFQPLKVNVVPLRGFNDDEIVAFARFAREEKVVVRFIEFMPLEAGDVWSRDMLVPGAEIREAIHDYCAIEPVDASHAAETAERFRFVDGSGEIGIIAPVTRAFCGACNRARITADGKLRTCLFSLAEIDLKGPMRAGASDADLMGLIGGAWAAKEAGHLINSDDFVRPDRTMSSIGG